MMESSGPKRLGDEGPTIRAGKFSQFDAKPPSIFPFVVSLSFAPFVLDAVRPSP